MELYDIKLDRRSLFSNPEVVTKPQEESEMPEDSVSPERIAEAQEILHAALDEHENDCPSCYKGSLCSIGEKIQDAINLLESD